MTIYECRLNRLRRQHLYAVVLTIVGLYLLSLLEFRGSEYWWSTSIGIALATGFSYLIGNTRVRIETTGETLTVYHSGMIQANIRMDTIDRVETSGSNELSRILVLTNDGSKHYIPCGCFSSSEIEALLQELKKA